jgi:hypothetical protein
MLSTIDLPHPSPRDRELPRSLMRGLPELRELLILLKHLDGLGSAEVLAEVRHGGETFPLIAIRLGPSDRSLPTLALFGGVHGLERIGTRVVMAHLKTVLEMARWDRLTQEILTHTRLLLVPLVNPVGMYLKRRANGNRVDLMRNAPVRAEGVAPWHLYAGHRLSSRLPWYQGPTGTSMETEAQALCEFVRREVFPAELALSVDVHSGYGRIDRLWFPYARTGKPFPHLPEALSLKHLLDRTYPNHIYCMEPQSRHYRAHGDLWDYLYDEYRSRPRRGLYLPFTLELGSWVWVRKNWSQMFSALGIFNPRLPHRVRRILRRHLLLFDFLQRAVCSAEVWTKPARTERERLWRQGLELWFAGGES